MSKNKHVLEVIIINDLSVEKTVQQVTDALTRHTRSPSRVAGLVASVVPVEVWGMEPEDNPNKIAPNPQGQWSAVVVPVAPEGEPPQPPPELPVKPV